ncbi:MAG: response regulator transcription factor [Nitrospira sp.]|nr:response regulator transcription factor [Nitrospira sp.]
MLNVRLIAGLLFLVALCVGMTDPSHAMAMSFVGTDAVVEDQPVLAGEASALVSDSHSHPQFETGGLNSITRAILHLRFCICSGLHQLFAVSSPLSTESTAPKLPAPAIPGAVFLFMTGLATVVGVARRTQGGTVRPASLFVQVEAPRIPLPGYLLCVSDDLRFAQGLATCFIRYGYVVESVPNTAEAGAMAARQAPALILLDRRRSGWQTVRQAAPFRSVPMMTVAPAGLGWTEDACVDDLEHGMDSTHVCDENSRLLIAKVRALLRRSAWSSKDSTVVRAGQVELDVDRCEVRVAGQANHLPPVQFKLLKRLMESPGTVFRRQALLDHIWGEGYAVEAHTLDVHIFWLRRLLERDEARRQTIATVRGVGIKFVVGPVSDRSPKVCNVWEDKATVRRFRTPQRRASSRRLDMEPAAIHTAV